MFFGFTRPTRRTPAYVYEVELNDPLPSGLALFDPVKEIAQKGLPPPAATLYSHDGLPDFLLGVVSPSTMGPYLHTPIKQPPPGGGTSRPANLTLELEALVRALRDSEILAHGNIPVGCITARFRVW